MKLEKLLLGLLLTGAILFSGGCGQDKQTSTSPALTPADDAPPLAPYGLQAPTGKISTGGFLLTWTTTPEADIAGYRAYRYDPSPERLESYVLLNPGDLVTESRFVYSGDTHESVVLRISAVDTAGHESLLSAPIAVCYLTVAGGQSVLDQGVPNRESQIGGDAGTPAPGPDHDNDLSQDGGIN
jgi:hypothetical protein